MKRLFPRVVPEAVGLLGLLVLAGAGCAPENNVKPGAPVLLSLAIVEAGGATTTVTADTAACSGGSDGGTIKTHDACNPGDGDSVCKLKDDEWCRCVPDPDDMTMMNSVWNCEPFAPMSVVIATFDRLLDSDPLDPGDAGNTKDDVAKIDATPKPAVDFGTATDYSSTGSTKGAVFNVFGPAFFGNQRSGGPNLQIAAVPALPTDSSVEIALVPTKVLAKDGKTQFTGENLLADGSIKFKTAPLQADLTIPMAPPPPPPAEDDGGADGGVADGAATGDGAVAEVGGSEGGTDAGASEGGGSEGGASDAGASEGGASDAGASDAGLVVDASIEAPTVDAAVDLAVVAEAGSDAAAEVAPPAPPTPGEPVPADMNMAPVVLTFNNVVDATDVAKHIKVTEDGQAFKVTVTADPMAPNTVNIAPGDSDPDAGMHLWAPGKTYVITVDADVTDVVGDKLGTALTATFMMAN